jgi:hypothetical protein
MPSKIRSAGLRRDAASVFPTSRIIKSRVDPAQARASRLRQARLKMRLDYVFLLNLQSFIQPSYSTGQL